MVSLSLDILFKALQKYKIIPILFIMWGLFLTYCHVLDSGFMLLPGDIGDGRLNHYFLEHSWLWFSGDLLHASYWDAPFFYPVKNVMAYSDTLLGTAPLYWIFRFAGMDYNTAYQFWPAALCVLNYICMYLVLRKVFGVDILPASLGAFLFAFCAPRLVKLMHIQFWPHFFSPLFIYCVVAFYKNLSSKPLSARLFLLAATTCLALQLYAGFYLGWFLVFGISVFFCICLCQPRQRKVVLNLIRSEWPWLACCMALFLLMVAPLGVHYLEAQSTFGGRSYTAVSAVLPQLTTWLRNTPSFLYRDFMDRSLPLVHEHWMGIGYFSLALCCYGLFLMARENTWAKCFALTALACMLLSLKVFDVSLWKIIWAWYPGAQALRAMTRIFFLVLIAFSAGLALALQKKRPWVQALVITICLAENCVAGYQLTSKERDLTHVAAIAERAEQEKVPFLLLGDPSQREYIVNLDAMWASIKANRPTINGYSGWRPRGYVTNGNIDFHSLAWAPYFASIGEDFLLVHAKADGEYETRMIKAKEFVFKPLISSGHELFSRLSGGLSAPEQWGIWMDGDKGDRASFALHRPCTSFMVRLRLRAITPQEVTIRAGVESRTFQVEKNSSLYHFTFELPSPVEYIDIIPSSWRTPKSLGINDDTRKLALGLEEVSIIDVSPCNDDTTTVLP